jgi:hypothetical protein
MDISRMVFDISALERVLERVDFGFEHAPDLVSGGLSSLGFNLAIGPESLPAGLTFDDGVVGWAVVIDEGGATTFEALKIDGNSVLGHGAGPLCQKY